MTMIQDPATADAQLDQEAAALVAEVEAKIAEAAPLHWSEQIARVLPTKEPLLVHGAPGRGKTYAIQEWAQKTGTPLFPVTLTLDSSAAELRGHFIQTPNGTEWTDGPAVRAMGGRPHEANRRGGLLLVNDVHLAGPDSLSLLYALMDRPESVALALPDGRGTVVRPADGYQVAATTNGRVQDLPEPLRSRLSVRVEAYDAAPEAVALLPENLRALLARYDLREILSFSRLIPTLGDKEAARAVFGAAAPDVLYACKLGQRSR